MSRRPSKINGAIRSAALLLIVALVPALPLPAQEDNDAYHQALLNYKTGKYAAARLAVNEAVAADADNIPAVLLQARILTELDDFDGARKALESLNDNPHLTPAEGDSRTYAWADMCLRKKDYDGATKFYESLQSHDPNNADLILKIVYSRIGAADLITAGKYASQLKPLDPVNPSYYFARAALAEATGQSAQAEQDIETVRTIYGITVANRYLKTYLQVCNTTPKTGVAPRATTPSTNAAP